MKKLKLEIELLYNDEIVHGNNPDAIDWFYSEILKGEDEALILHSNEIGDEIGIVKVIKIIDPEDPLNDKSD